MIDVRNPYQLAPPNRVPLPRTLPAKDARIGFRWINGGGVVVPRLGIGWVPAVVESLTSEILYVVGPTNGLRMALWLCDPWEYAPAADLQFWRACLACHRTGEVLLNPGKTCETCGGRGVRRHVSCEDCSGHGFLRGSELIVPCTECDGWAARFYDPFAAPRRPRQRRASPRGT